MNRFTKPLIVFFFLFVAGSLLPALGLHRAAAATISLSHDYSDGYVNVTLSNGSEEPKSSDDMITGGDDHYVYANLDAYDSNVNAERHSGYAVSGNMAGITLYGGDHATLATGSGVTASTDGAITSYYNFSVSSDYGSSAPALTHIVINEKSLPVHGVITFTIKKEDYPYTSVFGWTLGDGNYNDWITLNYDESYIVEASLSSYPFDGPSGQASDFSFTYDQSMEITVDETPVPLPGALWLLGSGLLGLTAVRRRRKL